MEKSDGQREYQRYVAYLVIITAIMVIPFWIINQLGVHSDWSYHAARVQQIFLNIKHGSLITYIGTDTFSKVGNGNFLFYPVIFLYPWALLRFIVSPVHAYVVYAWLLLLTTSIIAYYSMLAFTKNDKERSFYFALIYTFVPYHMYLTLSNYVIGEAQAYMFVPLIVVGMYQLIYQNKFLPLGIGMTLMAYSHYVSCVISIEVCAVILLFHVVSHRGIKKSVVINIFKSMGIFILLSFGQFVLLLTDYLGKNLSKPASGFFLMQTAGDYFVSSLSNLATNQGGVGFALIVTAAIGWYWIRHDHLTGVVYTLAVLFTFMITSSFPWGYLEKTPLAIIQFPYRYTSFAAVFLAVILSKGIKAMNFGQVSLGIKQLTVVMVLLGLYAGSVYPDVIRNMGKGIPVLNRARTGKYETLRPASDTPIIINDQNYNQQFSYGALYGETDYMPHKATQKNDTILNRTSYLEGKKAVLKQTGGPNKIVYHIKSNRTTKVNLPAIAYRGTNVLVNGKKTSYQISDRGTVQVTSHNDIENISVSYKPSPIWLAGWAMAAFGWLGILCVQINKFRKW